MERLTLKIDGLGKH